MSRLETEIIRVLANQPTALGPHLTLVPITAERVFVLCASHNSLCKLKDCLEDLVKRNQVAKIIKRGFKPTYRLIKTEVKSKPVKEPEAELEAMLAEKQELREQHAYMYRAYVQADLLLKDYLTSVTDPAIYGPLKAMRSLALMQLEELAEPANEEHGTSGIIRTGTG